MSEEIDRSKVQRIKLSDIDILKTRGRKNFQKILSLAESLKSVGLINPITVSLSKTPGRFELVAGERRYRAHLFLMVDTSLSDARRDYFSHIDVIDKKYTSDRVRKEVELIENVEREGLEFAEEAEIIRQLHELKVTEHGQAMSGKEKKDLLPGQGEGWTLEKTAQLVNQSSGSVSSKIKIAKKFLERPDLKERLKNLPLSVAIKEAERIEGLEHTEKQHKSGMLELSDKLILGSCEEVLKGLPSDSIDLVLTDPPFGSPDIQAKSGIGGTARVSFETLVRPTDNMTTEGVRSLLEKVLPELFRVMKPSAHFYLFFGFELYAPLILMSNHIGFLVDSDPLIWYKGRTTGMFSGYNYAQCYEAILYLQKPPQAKRLNKECKKLLEFPPVSKEEKLLQGNHPFTKPSGLLSYLIEQSSKKGDTLLDPFSGSGSTLLAGAKLSRSVLGIEKDEERFLASQKQLRALKG